MVSTPTPFTVSLDPSVISRLHTRLSDAVYPDQLTPASWDQGTELGALQEMVAYWRDKFDWKAQERRINEFHHFKMRANGIDVHFIHERSPDENALPLLLIHGWPGSFWEFNKIIHKLVDPKKYDAENPNAQAFHVIAPSLPGYGFSSKPENPGFGIKEMGKTLNELMLQLGYEKYVAHGGDWGSIISRAIALYYPSQCLSIHITLAIARPRFSLLRPWISLKLVAGYLMGYERVYSQEEARGIVAAQEFLKGEIGYQAIQGTKPQSLAYGLTDSPVALLAWILEKYRTWTDRRLPPTQSNSLTSLGEPIISPHVSLDDFFTIVTIYYGTGTISSSIRIYYEFGHEEQNNHISLDGYVHQPVGIAQFYGELYRPPREWVQMTNNIKSWTTYPTGGHFAGLEEPELLMTDIRRFFGRSLKESWIKL